MKHLPTLPRLPAVLASLMLAATPTVASTSPEITGLWMTEKKGIIVDLFDCEGGICGRTVWLKKMYNKDGSPRLDVNNPDPALRDRHWCGMQVISHVEPKSADKWDDGKVYDPKTGNTFDFAIKRSGEALEVVGYLGVKFLGKSETWTRTTGENVIFCTDS